MKDYDYKRRQFLQGVMAGAAATAFPGLALVQRKHDIGMSSTKPNPAFKPDVEIEFVAQLAEVPILPGPRTNVFKYKGRGIERP